MRSGSTAEQKEERTNKVSHDQIMDIYVARDWLDTYCLPDGFRLRLLNTVAVMCNWERLLRNVALWSVLNLRVDKSGGFGHVWT